MSLRRLVVSAIASSLFLGGAIAAFGASIGYQALPDDPYQFVVTGDSSGVSGAMSESTTSSGPGLPSYQALPPDSNQFVITGELKSDASAMQTPVVGGPGLPSYQAFPYDPYQFVITGGESKGGSGTMK
jgi:hypothetical protein